MVYIQIYTVYIQITVCHHFKKQATSRKMKAKLKILKITRQPISTPTSLQKRIRKLRKAGHFNAKITGKQMLPAGNSPCVSETQTAKSWWWHHQHIPRFERFVWGTINVHPQRKARPANSTLRPTQCPQPAVPTTPRHRTERSPKESKEQGKHRTFAELIPRSLWASGIFLASYKLPGVCVSLQGAKLPPRRTKIISATGTTSVEVAPTRPRATLLCETWPRRT